MTPTAQFSLPASVLRSLRNTSVIIFPTETIYGIGCSVMCEETIARVFQIKGRRPDQPPPVLIERDAQLPILAARVPVAAQVLMKKFWPGSLTLILPAQDDVAPILCGWNEERKIRTVGVRRTSHVVASALCRALGAPLVATSANYTGAVLRAAAPKSLRDIPDDFKHLADVVIDGGSVRGAPSTIVDCSSERPRLLRAGAIPLEELQSVLKNFQER